MLDNYGILKSELNLELHRILSYWANNTIDTEHGGFVGKINHYGQIVPHANKGIILNTRILWSFSAAANHSKKHIYQNVCDRAFKYLSTFFNDEKHKGVFWELDVHGQPINKRKQVYAQAFAIYALSEYYMFSEDETAKKWAVELFQLIEKHAKDDAKLGYFEAFNQNWSPIEDMRLSDKDMNASKTMNTHLHVLEAYTTLLKIYESDGLKASLKMLVELFLQKFLNKKNHYHLFFDDDWNVLSNSVSFGHDIEAAWLVVEAAKQLKDKTLVEQANAVAIKVADTFLNEGVCSNGAVLNEKNLTTGYVDNDCHWWPQMEALVGLNYVFGLTSNLKYLDASVKIWDYTKKYLIDHQNGEWFFRVNKNGNAYTEEDKVSMWKAPYHTTRACMMVAGHA